MGRGKLVAGIVVFVLVVAGMWGLIVALRWTPRLGLDLQGGLSIVLAPKAGQSADSEVLDQTVEIIRSRVDALGVAEPEITRQEDVIEVQLPGIENREQAREIIGRTAQLQMRPVLAVIPPSDPQYAEAGRPCGESLETVPPPEEEVVLCERTAVPTEGAAPAGDEELLPPEEWTKYRLGAVELTGTDIEDARAQPDASGLGFEVGLDLTGEGADKFEQITGELACFDAADPRRQFAIILDGVVESAPSPAQDVLCDQGISGGQAVITVGGVEAEARELALVLRTGALPIELTEQSVDNVSPTLGQTSLQAGLVAGAIGLALVAIYLIFLYRGMGLAALFEVGMFGLITLGLITVLGNTVGFTLTLAGIAGVIVSLGIAADSSIIYRERFKDELRAGRTIRTAADKAFTSSLRTNLTGNTTSFIAAVVLYLLTVGQVRGFAFTLGLSTLVDTILLVTFTRWLFALIARTPALANSRFMGLRSRVITDDSASPTGKPAGQTAGRSA